MFLIPHLGTIIWLVLIFMLVLFILAKFAWKPLLKALDERQTSVEQALSSAEEAKSMLAKIEQEQQKIIEEAKAEKERLVKEGFKQREKIISDARIKAQLAYDEMIADARKDIEQERKSAENEIRDQIAMLSVDIATRLIKGDLQDKSRHERFVRELVNDVTIN